MHNLSIHYSYFLFVFKKKKIHEEETVNELKYIKITGRIIYPSIKMKPAIINDNQAFAKAKEEASNVTRKMK